MRRPGIGPIAAALTVVAATVGFVVGGPTTAATAQSVSGEPCPDEYGVTVIVDFQHLGDGRIVMRCTNDPPSSGRDAMQRAGFRIEESRSVGFICRIDGLPTEEQDLCIIEPDNTAYWSYHHAPRGGDWSYSNWGMDARTPPAGTVDAWSFGEGGPPRIPPPDPLPEPEPPTGGGNGSGNGGSGGGGNRGSSTPRDGVSGELTPGDLPTITPAPDPEPEPDPEPTPAPSTPPETPDEDEGDEDEIPSGGAGEWEGEDPDTAGDEETEEPPIRPDDVDIPDDAPEGEDAPGDELDPDAEVTLASDQLGGEGLPLRHILTLTTVVGLGVGAWFLHRFRTRREHG